MTHPLTDETNRCRNAQRVWATLPVHERLQSVRRLRHLFADRADELALTVTQDIGRSADEVLATDIVPTADAFRFLEKNARWILKPRKVPLSQRPLWLMGCRDTVHHRPHGVVGIIGTWNYPIFLNAVQIVQALTAGNGVVWKPSEQVPMLAVKLHELFLEAGFPPDLFIRVPVDRDFGPQMAEADLDHVVFTGSADVGRKLAKRLGERLLSSTLELSGIDAMIVMADANLEMAAKAAWYGMSLNHGQTCIAVRRIFVERSVYPAFLDQLRPYAQNNEPQPLVTRSQAEQAERLVREAVAAGAKVFPGGEPPRAADEPPRYPPTFVADVAIQSNLCQEASFGPIAGIMPFDRIDDVVRLVNSCPYALGLSIFTKDRSTARELCGKLDAGMVTINDVIAPTAHPATPFGGRGASGWGVTQGLEGLLAMTIPQVVSDRSGSFRPHYFSVHGADPAIADTLRGLLNWRHGSRWRTRWSGFWRMIRAALRIRKS